MHYEQKAVSTAPVGSKPQISDINDWLEGKRQTAQPSTLQLKSWRIKPQTSKYVFIFLL